MNVALIDVDLPRNGKVKFPTLTLMKISAYCKARGDSVHLLTVNEYLREEFADVNMCYYLLFRSYETRQSIIMRPKWKRWALRLGYPGKGKEGEEQNG